jgi:hypothetical protein
MDVATKVRLSGEDYAELETASVQRLSELDAAAKLRLDDAVELLSGKMAFELKQHVEAVLVELREFRNDFKTVVARRKEGSTS